MPGTRIVVAADASVAATTGGTEYGMWRLAPASGKALVLRTMRLWMTNSASGDANCNVRLARVLDANVGSGWTDVTSTVAKAAESSGGSFTGKVYKGPVTSITNLEATLIYDGLSFPGRMTPQLGQWQIVQGENLILLVNHGTSSRNFLSHFEIDAA